MPPKAAKKHPAETAPAEDSSAGAEASAPSPPKIPTGRGRSRPPLSAEVYMMTFYHYTTRVGYQGIMQSRYIEQSSNLDSGDDARFGTGVYLTTVAPSEGKKQIVIVCFDQSAYPNFVTNGWVDYVFEIQIPPNQVERGTTKREVYLYKGRLMLDDFMWKAYPVPN